MILASIYPIVYLIAIRISILLIIIKLIAYYISGNGGIIEYRSRSARYGDFINWHPRHLVITY
jgi:hypothetical protein